MRGAPSDSGPSFLFRAKLACCSGHQRFESRRGQNFFTLTNKNKKEGPQGEGRRIEDGGTSKANKRTSRRRTTQPQSHHRRRHGRQRVSFWKPLRGQARGKESLKTTSGGWGHFFKWGACRAGGCEAACRQGEGRHVWKGGRRVPVHPPNLTQVS